MIYTFFLSIIIINIILTIIILKYDSSIINASIMSVCFYIISLGIFIQILAYRGCFNVKNVNMINMVIIIILTVFLFSRKNKVGVKAPALLEVLWIIGIIVLGSFIYIKYSITYVLADRDPFVYLLHAKNISDTQGIPLTLDNFAISNIDKINLLTGIDAKWYDCGFLPYSTGLFALGYSLAGFKGASIVNPILSIVAVLIIYVFTKKISKIKIAYIVSILMLLNPAEIWNGRVTQSEVICQIIFFLSMSLFYVAVKYEKTFYYMMSAIVLSTIHLVRIDMYLCGLGFSCYMLYLALFREKKELLKVLPSYMLYIFLSAMALIFGWLCTPTYINSQWDAGPLKTLVIFHFGSAILILVAVIVCIKYIETFPLFNFLDRFFANKWFAIIFGLVSYLWLKYNIFFAEKRNFVKWFCNYVGIHLFVLFFIGLIIILYTKQWKKILLFVIIASGNLILYLWDPNIAWDNIWISRRWVPICIPFITIVASYAIMEFIKNKVVQIFLVLSTLVFYCYSARGYITTYMFEGMVEDIKSVEEKLEENIVYYALEQKVSWPLEYLFNSHVYQLDKSHLNKSRIEEYLNKHKEFYYIGNIEELENISKCTMKYKIISENVIESYGLDRVYEKIPTTLFHYIFDANIYLITEMEG